MLNHVEKHLQKDELVESVLGDVFESLDVRAMADDSPNTAATMPCRGC